MKRPSFSKGERRVLRAMLECVAPPLGEGPLSIDGSGALDVANELATGQTRIGWIGLRFLFFAIEWLGLLIVAMPGRFSSMSRERRERFFRRMLHHPLYEVRICVRVVCLLCYTSYYSRGPVALALGFDREKRLEYARREPNPEGRWRASPNPR